MFQMFQVIGKTHLEKISRSTCMYDRLSSTVYNSITAPRTVRFLDLFQLSFYTTIKTNKFF